MRITREIYCFFQSIFQKAIDFAIPLTCPYCGNIIDSQQVLCNECFQKIQFISGNKCYRCGRPLPTFEVNTNEKMLCGACLEKRPVYDQARSVFIYDSFSREAILRLKYSDRTDLRRFFVHFMLKAGKELFVKTDIITPVPLHWHRKLKRMYNQADVLGELLAQKLNKPYHSYLLARQKNTHSQEHKSAQERLKNVQGAFRVNKPELVKNKTILIIDDVFTTGATVSACAKELKKYGAKAVYVLTIAQVIHE